MAPHGRCRYMRGVLLDEPARMLTAEVLAGVVAPSAGGALETALVLEFIPHGAINAVPAAETPYCRRLPGNAVAMAQWDDPAPGPTAHARAVAEAVAGLIKVNGEAYGNYGACSPSVRRAFASD